MTLKFHHAILAILSAIGLVISVFYTIPILGMVCLAPLLISLNKVTTKQVIISASLFSSVHFIFLFYWMPFSSSTFTGSIYYGIFANLFSTILFVSFFTSLFFIVHKLSNGIYSWKGIILLSSIFTFFEFLCDIAFKTLPWYNFHFGNPFLGSAYTVQLAEFGGIYFLTFFIILINGSIALCIKRTENFAIASLIIGSFFISNYLAHIIASDKNTDPIKISLLNANINPKTNWELGGNEIVGNIFTLNQQAALNRSDFNVWTESLVPWTYKKNDDFLNVLLKGSFHKTTTIIGMNTAYNSNTVYNSVYAIHHNNEVIGKYDKNFPLTFFEAPFSKHITKMFVNNGFSVKEGTRNTIINTEKGKLGVFLCNEATIAHHVSDLTKAGAQFLINMSNDGWFKDSYITEQHFYYNRLRAIENRRDIAINSNLGYSGKVSANGDIQRFEKSDFPTIHNILIFKNQSFTFYNKYPKAFITLISLLFLTLILFKKT
ncbi:apolipoprotein N-acyltransferase [Pedobacter alpinus]|uniref:Apolipoprotein N-acyltransferase n=1 Tax=Pedobacter alpinus TaxID=1590643 RepID=A0ABW5TTJ8_9SPHI